MGKLWKAKFFTLCEIAFASSCDSGLMDRRTIDELTVEGVRLLREPTQHVVSSAFGQSIPKGYIINPFTPREFKNYILPTVLRKMCKWCSENFQCNPLSSESVKLPMRRYNHLSSEKAMKSQILHNFWWGCKGNLKLITLGSKRVYVHHNVVSSQPFVVVATPRAPPPQTERQPQQRLRGD